MRTFPPGIERERQKVREWERVAPPADVFCRRRAREKRVA
jgi:hypothetical protein